MGHHPTGVNGATPGPLFLRGPSPHVDDITPRDCDAIHQTLLSTDRQPGAGSSAPCKHTRLFTVCTRATVSLLLSANVQMFWCGVLWSNSSSLSAMLMRPTTASITTMSESVSPRVKLRMERKGPLVLLDLGLSVFFVFCCFFSGPALVENHLQLPDTILKSHLAACVKPQGFLCDGWICLNRTCQTVHSKRVCWGIYLEQTKQTITLTQWWSCIYTYTIILHAFRTCVGVSPWALETKSKSWKCIFVTVQPPSSSQHCVWERQWQMTIYRQVRCAFIRQHMIKFSFYCPAFYIKHLHLMYFLWTSLLQICNIPWWK